MNRIIITIILHIISIQSFSQKTETKTVLGTVVDSESNKTFKINGKFRHTISGCNNTNNPEINCVEFIHFYNETKADILIGGSDIVNLAKYEVIDNRIDIEITDGLNINISFIIQDEMTLRRIESDDIWNKVE